MKHRPSTKSDWRTQMRVAGKIGLVLCMLFLNVQTWGQGWLFSYGAEKTDEGWAVLQTTDQGYLVVGFGESFGDDNDQDIFAIRTDVDGTTIWSAYYDEGFQEQARAIIATADGNYLIVGSIIPAFGEDEDMYLLKINPQGEKIWSRQFGGSKAERLNGAVLAKDGGFYVIGSSRDAADNEDILLAKFDAQGTITWSKEYNVSQTDAGVAVKRFPNSNDLVIAANVRSERAIDSDILLYRIDSVGMVRWEYRVSGTSREEVRDLEIARDGQILLAGVIGNNSNVYVSKVSAQGQKLWDTSIGANGVEEEANAIAELTDGSLVVTGLKVIDLLNVDIFLSKLDASGKVIWQKNLGDPIGTEEARDVHPTVDGGFILTGYNAQVLTSFNDLILVKTDGAGNLTSNMISGRVFHDLDRECDADKSEPGLSGWLVQAERNGTLFYGTTDDQGVFRIPVDSGSYNVRALPLNLYWDACIAQGTTVRFSTLYDSVQISFPMRQALACPFLEVEVATPFLAPCTDLEYTVRYRNIGTGTAANAYVDVLPDPKITFRAATRPYQVLPNGAYRFELGNLQALASGVFQIAAEMACTGIAIGQAALVKAHIYPDETCLQPDPNWDLSSVQVAGSCEGDSVAFKIKNVGLGDMESARRSIVIQDNIVLRQFDVQLKIEEEQTVKIPANGATFRVVVDQSTGHPGRSYPTAVVEGCATNGAPVSTGIVTMFPENDFDPFVSIDAQEIQAIALPVELRGYPKGYRDSIIAPETDLTFKILFKNTGTDTIHRMVIRDTLPQGLDPRRVTPGASNFSYRLEVYSGGIVKITLDSIVLPPAGNGNSGLGFVEFRVGQQSGNKPGTVLNNRATVYFDYQVPVTTQLLRYVVDKFPDFITVVTSDETIFVPNLRLQVYPNPTSESVNFLLEGHSFDKMTLRIFDLYGKLVDYHLYSGNQFTWYRNQLQSGMYVYLLESEGKVINSGKLIIR